MTIKPKPIPTEPRDTLAWMLAVFCLALLLRIVELDSVPANLNPDEADTLQTYLFALHTGSPGLFQFSWNGAPALNAYLIGWTWELLGRSVPGLRVMSAVLTAVACALFCLLLWRLTGRALLAAGFSLLLMTNPWFLNFSRSGWENAWNGATVLVVGLGFFHLYERREQVKGLALLVAGSALAFYFYHPGKLFVPAVLTILLAGQLLPRYRVPFAWIGVYAAGASLLILPQLLPVLCDGPETLSLVYARLVGDEQCVEQEEPEIPRLSIRNHGWHRIEKISVLDRDDPAEHLQEGTAQNLKGFLRFDRADFDAKLNRRYVPAQANPIPPPLAVLYGVGLVVAAIRFPYLLLLGILVLLPVQILSIDTPDAARAVHAVPLIFLFAALPVHLALRVGRRYGKRLGFRVVYTVVAIGILFGAGHQAAGYWRWISLPETLSAREPAIPLEEYPLWLDALETRIEETGNGFTVSHWKMMNERNVQRSTGRG